MDIVKELNGDVELKYEKTSVLPESKKLGNFSWPGRSRWQQDFGPVRSTLGFILAEAAC